MGTSLGPHLISLLRGARWEGAPGSAGAGAVAADRRRAIARSRRLSSALSAARAAGGHRAAHREYGDVPLERSAAAVHAQTGCLSSWPELASPDREGVRRVGQMGGHAASVLRGSVGLRGAAVSGAGLRWAFSWRTLRRGTSPNVAIVWVGGQCAAAAAESRRNRSGAHGEGS